jgi:hypothetical protein
MQDFKAQLEAMIDMYDYVEVARIYLSDDAARQFAFLRNLWILRDKERDSCYLWNGKGEDPRSRKRAQRESEQQEY